MKVAGFSIIRNGAKFDYPIIEAILSILDICDMFFLGLGDCDKDDETEALIKKHIPADKIKIFNTIWNPESLGKKGKIFAEETSKIFQKIPPEYDWAFYIQADEVLHERFKPTVIKAMKDYLNHSQVEGLLFKYLHFYGGYEYIATSWSWYRHEIRIVRNRKDIYSYRDAQGFRIGENQKLKVKEIDAYIYHYGWVRIPEKMTKKLIFQDEVQRELSQEEKENREKITFKYPVDEHRLVLFKDSHPKIMQQRISRKDWEYHFDPSRYRVKVKDKVKDWFYKYLGVSLGYKNYKRI